MTTLDLKEMAIYLATVDIPDAIDADTIDPALAVAIINDIAATVQALTGVLEALINVAGGADRVICLD